MRRASWPPKGWGDPVRAVIAPTACGGFLLFVTFTHAGLRCTGVDLGTRCDDYDAPDAREITAAEGGLSQLGLTRTAPWASGSVRGSLTAPVTLTPRPSNLVARLVTALRTKKAGTR